MKTNILMTFFLILSISTTKGGERDSLLNNKHYAVNLLVGQNQIKEMNTFPLVHKGVATEFSFETEKVKSSLRHFQLFITYSRIKTSLEEMAKSANIRLGLNYSFNFLISQKDNLRYYLGPQMSLCYSLMIYPNWDESHSYWADHLSFGANNILSVALKKEREWFTSLNVSLCSLFSRPDKIRPYKIDDYTPGGVLRDFNSNLETGFINNALQINLKTEYRFPVFTSKREAITFSMDILRLSGNDADPVLQIINRIGIKIML